MDLAHYCTGCGQMHGGSEGEPEAVKIAKINADRDIAVARLARSETREIVEGDIEQTGIEAEAAVEEAVVKAEVLDDLLAPPPDADPGPVELPDGMPEPDPEPDLEAVPEPPETDPTPPSAKNDSGWWAGYR